MATRDNLNLGPLTRTVLDTAVWREKSEFPATQTWADEFERVLSFLESQSMFERFLPRLRARERAGALAEARVGFFFHRNGFRIPTWEPVAVPGRPGDLEVRWRHTEAIFVEVKGPGWKAELSAEERADRKRLPKYLNAEVRTGDPVERVLYAVEKALPKLAPGRPNLVVVADDLFLSPLDLPRGFREAAIKKRLSDLGCVTVGAVLLLNAVSYNNLVEYRKFFIPNAEAAHPIPTSVQEGLMVGNQDPQGLRRTPL